MQLDVGDHQLRERLICNNNIKLYIDGKQIANPGYDESFVTASLKIPYNGTSSFYINDSTNVRVSDYIAYIGNCGGKSYKCEGGTVTYYYLSF